MSILIIGSGISGLGAAQALNKMNRDYKIIDNYNDNDFDGDLSNINLIILSPAISIDCSLTKRAKSLGIPIISEIELGYYIDDAKLICITGTNGKTTVSKMLYEIIKKEHEVILAGNIGTSYSKDVSFIKHDTSILELSSFQLESVLNFRPNIAAITNIGQDHLDRHKNIENYIKAKLNITKNQRKEDHLVLNSNIPIKYLKNLKTDANVWYISNKEKVKGAYCLNDNIFFNDEYICNKNIISLKGVHNLENVLIAVAVSKLYNISNKHIKDSIINFKSERHRIEYIGTFGGINYFNDSKGTNLDATKIAVDCMEGETCLIMGGSNKGYEFDELINYIKNKVQFIVIIGETKEKIKNACLRVNFKRYILANTFEEAILIASLQKVKNVLLSPATASFDMFNNYQDRGNKYIEIINKLYLKGF